MFQFDHTDELYAHMNINYIKLDRLPAFERWGEAVEPLCEGRISSRRTGEVYPRRRFFEINANEVMRRCDAQWTFPLRYAENRLERRQNDASRDDTAHRKRASSASRRSDGAPRRRLAMGAPRSVGYRDQRRVRESAWKMEGGNVF